MNANVRHNRNPSLAAVGSTHALYYTPVENYIKNPMRGWFDKRHVVFCVATRVELSEFDAGNLCGL